MLRRLFDVNYSVEPVISSTDRRTMAVDTVHVARMKPYISPESPVPNSSIKYNLGNNYRETRETGGGGGGE